MNQMSFIPKKNEQYEEISNGHLHPSWVLRELSDRRWVEDIWDLEYTRQQRSGRYTQAFDDAYQDFVHQAEESGITNNKELLKHIQGKIAEIRRMHKHQTRTQELIVDA